MFFSSVFNRLIIILFYGKRERESKVSIVGGMLLAGSLLIGFGPGILYDIVVVGLFLGLGVGFLLFGLIWAFTK